MKSKGRGEEFCYTSESMYTGDRRNPKYTAHDEEIKNTAEQKDKGPQKTEYKFRYDDFVDFDSHEAFCKELQDALQRQSVVSVTPSKSPQCVMAEREHKTCISCTNPSCDLKDSFMEAWEVNWVLQGISICPNCGEKTVYQIREIPKLSLKIHDVRMTGHPARLILNKTKNWGCSNCGSNISRARIPGIQCVAGGEFTLRLLRSIFELNVAGVPNGFIAEGYDLKRNYVGELCRKFQAQTEKIFSEKRNAVLVTMPSEEFYGETVFVQGKKYQAIFDKKADKFYTILPEQDILAVFESVASDGSTQLVRKSLREPVALYAFYAAVITRDISKRHKIRNKELFDRVVKYIVENVGKTFSANAIVKFLKNEQRSLSVETVYNYLKWLSEAFIIYPCRRYDIQGKSVLKTQEKYYLSDISIKYSKMGFDRKMISAMLENIVFLEMKRRGYEVYIGKNDTKEIDFIGIRREEKVYIQVCVELPIESTRETDNLMDIKDHYHKYVVCKDALAVGNDNGIEIVHIADFLLKDEW